MRKIVQTSILKLLSESEIFEISFFEINGTVYQKNFLLKIDYDDGYPVIIIIKNILKDKNDKIYFIYNVCETVGYHSNYKSFEILLPSKKIDRFLVFNNNYYMQPFNFHQTAVGKMVNKRDLE